MEQTIAKGKFLLRVIHVIAILSMLLIFLLMIMFFSPSFRLTFVIILVGLLDFVLLYTSLPKKLSLNDNGIYVKNPLSSKEKQILWEDIQTIEEKIYYRRDKFLKILMYIILYGIFFLLFKEKYRCLTITDNQFMRYTIYEYSYDEYDKICEIIKTKCNKLLKNDSKENNYPDLSM